MVCDKPLLPPTSHALTMKLFVSKAFVPLFYACDNYVVPVSRCQ